MLLTESETRIAYMPYSYSANDVLAVIYKLFNPDDWEQFGQSKNHVITTLYQVARIKRLHIPYEFEQAIFEHPEIGLRINQRYSS